MQQSLTIAHGFGARLREERERLGLSQTALASFAGVKRLAQSQYEKETSAPNVRYLSAIGNAGINLDYLLFGRTARELALTPEEAYRVEAEAFRLLEEFIQNQPTADMGAEGRFALFQVFRGNLVEQIKQNSGA